MDLRFDLCDLAGQPLALLDAVSDGDAASVTIPLNQARTATVDISLFDDEALMVAPLSSVLRVTYGEVLAFAGAVGRPSARGAAGTLTIPARDQTRRLERRFLRLGHVSVEDGYTRDGRGVRTLLADAEPETGAAVPTDGAILRTGIVPGGGPSTNDVPDVEDVTKAERGSRLWDAIEDLTRAQGGLDVELVPVDQEHPPLSRGWQPGDLCELRTWAYQGTDRTDPDSPDYLSLDYGCGAANLEDFEAGPDGESVCNYAVAVASGGETDVADDVHRQLAHDANWRNIGIYQRWEPVDAGENLPPDELRKTLRDRARFLVATYADAPVQMDLTLPPDRDDVPAWGRDFEVGDRVHVALKRGVWSFDGDVRIVEVTLRRDGQAGGTRQGIRVVPAFAGQAIDDDEGA